jgi:hypothetical protein
MNRMAAILQVQKDEFKIIEEHLKNYHIYVAGLENFREQMERLFPNITTAYTLREGSMGTFMFKSDTEEYGIDRAEISNMMKEQISIYEIVISSIERALKSLDETEREFVEYRYFKNWSVKRLAVKMGYSYRNMYEIRDCVKRKLMISLRNLISIEF